MAQGTTIKYGQQALLIGNGAVPEVFVAPCGLTSLNKVTNINTTTTEVPDCDDPDLSSWLEIDPVSKQMVLSGSGVLTVEYLKYWDSWDGERDPNSGAPLADLFKNVRWYRNILGANGGGYYQGPGLLTRFEEAGANKGRYQVTFSITFSGKPLWVPAA